MSLTRIIKVPSVYVFYNESTGFYKIGYSADVDKRRKTMIAHSGCYIICVWVFEFNYPKDPNGFKYGEHHARKFEKKLHQQYKNLRVVNGKQKTEWFSLEHRWVYEMNNFLPMRVTRTLSHPTFFDDIPVVIAIKKKEEEILFKQLLP